MAPTRLDKKLNVVIPIWDDADGADSIRLWVHAQPITEECYETYFRVIGRAHNEMLTGDLGYSSGARQAYFLVRDYAKKYGEWEGEAGVENGLVNEVIRLANVLKPADGKGWETIPLHTAITQNLLSKKDQNEVLNALVFFTLVSSMASQAEVKHGARLALGLWGGLLEQSNCSEFENSLRKSKETADSTKAAASSAQS